MNRLSHADFDQVSTALEELYGQLDAGELPQTVLELLSRLVSTDRTSYNELDLSGSKAIVIIHPPSPDVTPLLPVFEAHLSENPNIAYYHATKDGRPYKTSDFLSQRQFQRLGLYQEFYRLINVRGQLAFYLSDSRGMEIGIALNRSSGDFSERDRGVLALFRPHVMRAYLNALIVTSATNRCRTFSDSLDATDQALIVLAPDDRIAWFTPLGAQLLERYFPGAMRNSSHLPEPLRTWARRQLAALQDGQALAQPPEPLTVCLPDSRLVARLAGTRPGEVRLLLTEERSLSPLRLKSLGLTKREAEVLHWVSEGKTNPEIGTILNLSTRTVHKHLEHILAKLGVETRTAAMRIAMGL
jgi:DNA-binding CsgD family transcriptional regulator